MLNQDELKPWSVEDEVAAVYSGTGGYLDRIKVDRIPEFHSDMLAHLHAEQDDLMRKIAAGEWDDDIEQQLGDAIAQSLDDFGPDFDEEGEPLEEGESDRVRDAGDKAEKEEEKEEETATA
jgi:F-type H+-transporting ATPase subunit alpha